MFRHEELKAILHELRRPLHLIQDTIEDILDHPELSTSEERRFIRKVDKAYDDLLNLLIERLEPRR